MIPWDKILKNIWRVFFISAITLFFVYVLLQFIEQTNLFLGNSWIFKFFDFRLEGNLPTFLSGFLFIVLSISTYFCGIFDKYKGLKKRDYLPWMYISFLFLFLSIDEFSEIHEQLTDTIQQFLGVGGFLFFAWIVPYFIVFLLLAIYFIPFLLKISRKSKLYIFIGALIFIFGAIGLEMIGAKLYESGFATGFSYKIISSLEEILEIIGLLLAL